MTYVEPECKLTDQVTNAGYEVKSIEYYAVDGDIRYGVATGSRSSKGGISFVTWECKENKNTNEVSFFWGHYFSDKNAALSDYHQRLSDCYGRHISEATND